MEDFYDLEWVAESTVRFSVYDFEVSDDDGTNMTVAPYLVEYAVSILGRQAASLRPSTPTFDGARQGPPRREAPRDSGLRNLRSERPAE